MHGYILTYSRLYKGEPSIAVGSQQRDINFCIYYTYSTGYIFCLWYNNVFHLTLKVFNMIKHNVAIRQFYSLFYSDLYKQVPFLSLLHTPQLSAYFSLWYFTASEDVAHQHINHVIHTDTAEVTKSLNCELALLPKQNFTLFSLLPWKGFAFAYATRVSNGIMGWNFHSKFWGGEKKKSSSGNGAAPPLFFMLSKSWMT